jgi:hypothetical protein
MPRDQKRGKMNLKEFFCHSVLYAGKQGCRGGVTGCSRRGRRGRRNGAK